MLNNFSRLAYDWPIESLAKEIAQNSNLFQSSPNVKKEDIGYSHRQASIIVLRYPHIPEDILTNTDAQKRVQDDLYAITRPAWAMFPSFKPLLYALMEKVEGTHIGGIGIVKLPAGKMIDMHYDNGLATDFYARYHIIVNGPKECWFICGKGDDKEKVAHRNGEVWWFDSHKIHGVKNLSQEDRISVSIDICSR